MHSLELFGVYWILASCAVLFAAFVRGVAGFGLALILAPILLIILDPKSVVVVNLLLGVISNILVILYGFRNKYLNRIILMAASSLPGIAIGIWIITIIAPSFLKVIIGAITILFVVPLTLGFARVFVRERLACGVSGFLSGILSSSTSLGGPPVVLLMYNQKWDKETIHSSLAVYFLFICVCSLISLAVVGLVDVQTVISAATLIPALLIGIGLGMVTFRRVNVRFFRMLTLGIVVVTGIMGILSGLGVL